jgi:hypothetical protein
LLEQFTFERADIKNRLASLKLEYIIKFSAESGLPGQILLFSRGIASGLNSVLKNFIIYSNF